MPRLRRALEALPSLEGCRIACSIHLDIKMIPLIEGLMERGAAIYLITCNPTTVRDEVATYLQARGAQVEAWHNMPPAAYEAAIRHALEWGPTHLCEMGADLTHAYLTQEASSLPIRASLEATGSGIARLVDLVPPYPIFNWDDLPVKEGLHNRRMVGLTTWHTFFERTRLTLHGKQVAVIGYGSVGRGVADSARAYGGAVWVVERDPARALEAHYAGWMVVPMEQAVAGADVIVTATGGRHIVNEAHFSQLKEGAFLLNVGHRADEIDVATLRTYPHQELLPFVEEFEVAGRKLYLLAGGSMANLTAGPGDSLNAFDVTLAVMVSGVGHVVGEGERAPAGVHVLPRTVWQQAL